MLSLTTKFVTLILFLFIGTTNFSNKHPLHVSTTELNFNSRENSIEISSKVFTDDFEAVLSKLYKQKIDLSNPSLSTEMDVLVRKYLITHLQLKVNGKLVNLNYIGFEIDHEAVNVYLEVKKIKALKTVQITNTILYDLFDDQMSIIHIVNKNGIRKSGKILYPERNFEANF